jgi:aspartate kinase
MSMIVMKFGGSSLGTSDALTRVAGLIAARASRTPVVVVSAIGKTTDRLLAAVAQATDGRPREARRLVALLREALIDTAAPVLFDVPALETLLDRHVEEIDRLLTDLAAAGPAVRSQVSDAVVCHGERISSLVMTRLLRQHGLEVAHVDARDVLVTDGEFTRAAPLFGPTNDRLRALVRPLAAAARIVVMGGFIARTQQGQPSTLGRGGSDFTASIVGAGIDAEEIQIWTDVDGIMTADPSVIPDAKRLRQLSFTEASELAYFGARVLHPSTVLPAIERNIPVRVLNSRKPEVEGTLIMAECPPSTAVVKSIACKEGIAVIDIRSTRMLMAHGFLAAIFEVFDRYRTSVDVVSTSEVGVSLTIDRTDRLDEIGPELQRIADVTYAPNQAIVCLVGDAISHTPGVAATIFTALEAINIRMISQGSSRTNVSIVIDERDLPMAVRALHHAFFADPDETLFG